VTHEVERREEELHTVSYSPNTSLERLRKSKKHPAKTVLTGTRTESGMYKI
jgi:hypothetical protein